MQRIDFWLQPAACGVQPRMRAILACVAFAVVAACQAPQGVEREIPAPALELLSSAALQIPDTCLITGSVAVLFSVQPDGQTADIRPIAVPDCARAALSAWVASFRYLPPGQRMPARIEWLAVSGSRTS